MKYEGIPDPGMLTQHPRIYVKEISGRMHRCCFGPAHDFPTWLPETGKYFYMRQSGKRKGTYVGRCHLCVNWDKIQSPGQSGMVPMSVAYPFFRELVGRIGKSETSRRTGLSINTISAVLNGRYKSVQKRTVRALMLELISARRKGEVYHKDVLRFGLHNRRRVKPYKEPKHQHDLYYPHGDNDNESRRAYRKKTGK